jgi:phosphatidylcholine synthase
MSDRLAAWSVHFYTALGLPLAMASVFALMRQDVRTFFFLNCVAVFVDATDGTFARRFRVREVLPEFSGRRLDDIVDFLTFAFLPSLALVAFGLLPPGWEELAALPVLASAYGFCQEQAKTEDAFVGFPSYWNVLVLYAVLLGAGPWLMAALLVVFGALVFVPVHYVYPTKTKLLRNWTLGFGVVWAAMLTALSLFPTEPWSRPTAWATLAYPAWYIGVSLVHHRRVHGDAPRAAR